MTHRKNPAVLTGSHKKETNPLCLLLPLKTTASNFSLALATAGAGPAS